MAEFMRKYEEFWEDATSETGAYAFFLCLAFKALLLLIIIKGVIVALWTGHKLFPAIFVGGIAACYYAVVPYSFFYVFTIFWSRFARNVFFIIMMPLLLLWTLFVILPAAGTVPKTSLDGKPYDRTLAVRDDAVKTFYQAKAGDSFAKKLIADWEYWNPGKKWDPDHYLDLEKEALAQMKAEQNLHANDTTGEKWLFWFLTKIGMQE